MCMEMCAHMCSKFIFSPSLSVKNSFITVTELKDEHVILVNKNRVEFPYLCTIQGFEFKIMSKWKYQLLEQFDVFYHWKYYSHSVVCGLSFHFTKFDETEQQKKKKYTNKPRKHS